MLTNIIHCQLSVNVGFKISWDPGCSDDEIELKIKLTWKLKFDWNSMSHNTASRDHMPTTDYTTPPVVDKCTVGTIVWKTFFLCN